MFNMDGFQVQYKDLLYSFKIIYFYKKLILFCRVFVDLLAFYPERQINLLLLNYILLYQHKYYFFKSKIISF
jgi:hypothetical protein